MSDTTPERAPDEEQAEGATPGTVGALDGAAALGSRGATPDQSDDAGVPTDAPDPMVGPD